MFKVVLLYYRRKTETTHFVGCLFSVSERS
nr:MAG TPA: hypothetical protein [Caudoviricetes sp.]